MSTNIQSALADVEYKNWLKAGLSLKYAREGILNFVKNDIDNFHQDLLNILQAGSQCSYRLTENIEPCRINNNFCKFAIHTCKVHNRTDLNKIFNISCPNIVDQIYTEIIKEHRYTPTWRNTDCNRWCSQPWQLAKWYMPEGYASKVTAADTDFSGLVNVIINNRRFDNLVNDNMGTKSNIFCQARDLRNTILHKADMRITDTDLAAVIQTLQTMLSNPKCSTTDPDIQHAQTRLTQIKNGSLFVTPEAIDEIKAEACMAIEEKKQEALSDVNKSKEEAEIAIKQTTDDACDETQKDRYSSVTNSCNCKPVLLKMEQQIPSLRYMYNLCAKMQENMTNCIQRTNEIPENIMMQTMDDMHRIKMMWLKQVDRDNYVTRSVARTIELFGSHVPLLNDIMPLKHQTTDTCEIMANCSMAVHLLINSCNNATDASESGTAIKLVFETAKLIKTVGQIEIQVEPTLNKIRKMLVCKSSVSQLDKNISSFAFILDSSTLHTDISSLTNIDDIEQLTVSQQAFSNECEARSELQLQVAAVQFNLQQNRLRLYEDCRLFNKIDYIVDHHIIIARLSSSNQDKPVCIFPSHSFHKHLCNETAMNIFCYFVNKCLCTCHESQRKMETESENENISYALYGSESDRSIYCEHQETQIKWKPISQGTNTQYTVPDSESSNEVSHGINIETRHEIMNHEHVLNNNEQETDSHKVSAWQTSLSNENIDNVLLKTFLYEPSFHNIASSSVIGNESFEDVRVGRELTTAEQTIDSCHKTDDNIIEGTEDTDPSGQLYFLTNNGDNTSYGERTELVSLVLPSKLTDAYSYAQKPSAVRLQNEISSVGAEYNVLDLKQKVRRKQRNYHKLEEINKAFKYKHKHDYESKGRDNYVEDLRNVTWLPLELLPVPKVEIDVRRIEFDPLNTIIEQLARDENPGPHITMRYELLRFCTLRNYPKRDKPYLIRISGAGFYYAAEGDELVCYCCGMRKSGWTESDQPMEIHNRLSPRCSFLVRNEDVNVRVPEGRNEVDRFAFLNDPTPTQNSRAETTESNSNSSSIERVSSPNVNNETQADFMSTPVYQELNRSIVNSSSARPERPQRRHGNFSYSSNSSTEIATTTSNSSAPQSAAATRNPQPKHPNYAPRSVRVASFQGWPDDLTQTPEVLSDAGFYYAGIADCVRCYFCGLGLRHWSEEDNPWIEHARWSRPCLYVKMIKGEEFINLVHLAVQYTENERTQNEEQQSATATGETNTEHEGRQIPIDEINRLLLTDAAQSVLDMGYQADIIKKAIEKVLIRDGRAGISSTNIMAMIFEIEEEETEAALTNRVNNIEISNADNLSTNANEVVAHSTVNTASANALNTTSNSNETIPRNQPSNRSLPTSTNALAASSMTTANTNASLPDSRTETPPSKSNTNRKDAKTVKKENERMKMQTMCQICKNNTVAIVFLPCGHLVTCETCAPTLRNCPMPDCDKIVKGTVKAFMA